MARESWGTRRRARALLHSLLDRARAAVESGSDPSAAIHALEAAAPILRVILWPEDPSCCAVHAPPATQVPRPTQITAQGEPAPTTSSPTVSASGRLHMSPVHPVTAGTPAADALLSLGWVGTDPRANWPLLLRRWSSLLGAEQHVASQIMAAASWLSERPERTRRVRRLSLFLGGWMRRAADTSSSPVATTSAPPLDARSKAEVERALKRS